MAPHKIHKPNHQPKRIISLESVKAVLHVFGMSSSTPSSSSHSSALAPLLRTSFDGEVTCSTEGLTFLPSYTSNPPKSPSPPPSYHSHTTSIEEDLVVNETQDAYGVPKLTVEIVAQRMHQWDIEAMLEQDRKFYEHLKGIFL